ncbi:MAG: FGGY-family carbohydrate kinase, partial [Ruthenibacterium sp.]
MQVFTAGGDQQVASLGLGVLQAGRAEVTHGTGSFCIFHSDKVVQDEKTQLICNVAAVPGAYIIESSCLTTGAAYDWLLKEFYACTGYAQINEEIATTPPLSNGVVVLPHFQGVGAPDWNPQAKGMICNLSLCSKRGDIARALLEGIAVDVARNLEMIEKAVGQAQVLCLSGGLTNLPAFNQLQADIYNRCTVICS